MTHVLLIRLNFSSIPPTSVSSTGVKTQTQNLANLVQLRSDLGHQPTNYAANFESTNWSLLSTAIRPLLPFWWARQDSDGVIIFARWTRSKNVWWENGLQNKQERPHTVELSRNEMCSKRKRCRHRCNLPNWDVQKWPTLAPIESLSIQSFALSVTVWL